VAGKTARDNVATSRVSARRGVRVWSRPTGDRGASAVEFALLVPVLLLFVFGIIQFGMTFGQILALNNPSRQGARVGVVGMNPCSAVVAQVQQGSVGAIGATYPLNVTVTRAGIPLCTAKIESSGTTTISYTLPQTSSTPTCPTQSSTQALTVTTKSTGTFTIPPFFFIKNFTVTGSGVFQCELG
jgi:Flp pilus assembly protein TadG